MSDRLDICLYAADSEYVAYDKDQPGADRSRLKEILYCKTLITDPLSYIFLNA